MRSLGRVDALLDYVALRTCRRIPTEIDFAVAVSDRYFQARGRVGHSRRTRGRSGVHTGAGNQALVSPGHAFYITGALRDQLS
jgi:hypothetical protein